MSAKCIICPRHCILEEGDYGYCRARKNEGGQIICANYGKLTSLALDPIEKKPLAFFYPGSMILSVGSFGCNLNCPFCQNHEISMAKRDDLPLRDITPGELTRIATNLRTKKNIGIAYTYNEPLIGYEFVRDCAAEIKKVGMKNVLVTNGNICSEPLRELLPLIDALNIDLKACTQDFYDMIGGNLETVMNTIAMAHEMCHVEVTTLIIPGKNDSKDEMKELSSRLASISPDIPLHVSRYFPNYQMSVPATPVKTVYALADIASQNLSHVLTGNC